MQQKFLRRLAGATAGLVLTGTSTFAADLGVAPPPPPPPPVFTWTGFELGVQVGGGAGETGVVVNGIPLFPPSDRYGSSGVFGGIHVGFNYQFASPIVAGVQLEYNFAGITGTASTPPLNYLETSIRQFGSADARLGVAFDRLLLYAIGGFAYADIRNQIQLDGLAPGIIDFFSVNRYGWDVGGGLEYNFYGNWTARAEYRYYDWGTRGFNTAGFGSVVNTFVLPFAIPNHTSRETMQTGRVGLTYKFAWPSTPVVAKY